MARTLHHPRGAALRAQALALRAQADALELEAEAIEVEGSTSPRSGGAALDFVPAKGIGLPRTTLDNLRRLGAVRSARVGREVFVSRMDVDRWLGQQSQREARAQEPNADDEPNEPADVFERARSRARARSERRAS